MKDLQNFKSRRWRINNIYPIIDKKQNSVVFKMNEAQELVYNKKVEHKQLLILKGRQLGITTLECICKLDMALLYPNQHLVITAHTQAKQKEIFQKVKYAYENMIQGNAGLEFNDENNTKWTKPGTLFDNVSELHLDNNSVIRVALDSRGGTVSGLHLTELAFKQGAEEMMNGTMPSVVDGAEVTVETTANGSSGVGKYFYDIWKKAESGVGDFKSLFLGWYLADEYERDYIEFRIIPEANNAYKFLKTLYPEEKAKRKAYWYSKKMESLGVPGTLQEYPTFPEEAFDSTGSSVFDIQKVKALPKYDFEDIDGIRIYGRPEDCNDPMDLRMGVDTATGRGEDYSCFEVRDTEYNLIAHFYERCYPEVLFEKIRKFEEMGYGGIIGPEINNTSGGELLRLLLEFPLQNFDIHQRETPSSRMGDGHTREYGFLTNTGNRGIIIERLERLFRQNLIAEYDDRMQNEMKYFYESEKGKKEASPGEHDDAIMTCAITLEMCEIQKATGF